MNAKRKSSKAGILAAAAAVALLAAPAYAQKDDKDSKTVIDPDSLPEAKALDRQYRQILNRMPDQQGPHDPWASVRASEVPSNPPAKDKKNSTAAGSK